MKDFKDAYMDIIRQMVSPGKVAERMTEYHTTEGHPVTNGCMFKGSSEQCLIVYVKFNGSLCFMAYCTYGFMLDQVYVFQTFEGLDRHLTSGQMKPFNGQPKDWRPGEYLKPLIDAYDKQFKPPRMTFHDAYGKVKCGRKFGVLRLSAYQDYTENRCKALKFPGFPQCTIASGAYVMGDSQQFKGKVQGLIGMDAADCCLYNEFFESLAVRKGG